MCIVIAKPAGAPIPSMQEIETCWLNNPDGAGLMYLSPDGRTIITKGYMTLESYMDALAELSFTESDTVVYHFRIATAGSVVPANTHPFPASSKVSKLRALDLVADCGIAHNGILDYPADTANDLSDTMTFIRDVFHDTYIRHNTKRPAVKKAIAPIIGGSKIAILERGTITLIGKFIEDAGRYYSNDTYKRVTSYASWIRDEMALFADTGICPDCYADIPNGDTACPACGALQGRTADVYGLYNY